MSEFRFDPNSTKNEGRWRLRDPKSFDQKSYRRWSIYKGVQTEGVGFVVGKCLDTGKTEVQAIRFNKGIFTEEQAARWWAANQSQFTKVWTEADWANWEGDGK